MENCGGEDMSQTRERCVPHRPPLGEPGEDSSTRLRVTQVPGEKRPVSGS